jgi:flagellin
MANVDITRIAGNIGALNALNSLNSINSELASHQTKLATGKAINSAADDPSGMSLATTFDVRRQGLTTAIGALGDAKNLMSTMEGGLTQIQDILVQMRNKAEQAQGDTIGASERDAISGQLTAYASEIDDIVKQTQWNSTNLLSGSAGAGSQTATMHFLSGPDSGSAGQTTFSFSAGSSTSGSSISASQGFSATSTTASAGLGLTTTVLGTSSLSSGNAATAIDNALNIVKQGISQIGSFTARLDFKMQALTTQQTNTESAYNRIMSTDMAAEQVAATKNQILQQTATAMLSQANTSPQVLLTLFK